MPNFYVKMHYNPGTPKTYLVREAKDWLNARNSVLAHIGYNPGVHISVRPVDWEFDYEIKAKEISPEELELIRYND